jgi:hypothetical protein
VTVDPLLNPVDFAKFQAKDQDWFLGAVGETIRDYCNWHIAPIISVTDVQAKIGNQGIIMLPTLNLVSVERLSWCSTDMPADSYDVHDSGWLQQRNPYFGSQWFRGMRNAWVTVDFTHGYETLPKAVAEVGYELTGRVLEKPAGIVTKIQRGPTNMEFGEFGVVLSEDQKSRLGPYRVMRV